jgi:riboflavin kinase/FMN adenylyltransferase
LETHHKASTFNGKRKTVVTIGTFDGVHFGHRKIIKRLTTIAKQKQLDSALLTFFPHPRMVLQQSSDLKLINTIEEKKQLLAETGLDHLVIEPFTMEFSRLKAEEYIEEYLIKHLNAAVIIVGYDHRFGRNRKANIEDLKAFSKEYDFEVIEISKQDVDDVAISSTKIRSAIQSGEIDLANRYLTKPFMLTGKVVKGKQLGKSLGYPTANLKIEEDYKILPNKGVYVVKAKIKQKWYFGMMNIGHNPTIAEGNHKSVETYFFDFNGNLYDQPLQILMLKRIRDEKKFNSVEALKSAMESDEIYSKKFIKNHA